jgi:N-acetylglucosamine kinase-like BadF-type ATPase
MENKYVIGIDGGGTKTAGAAVSMSGQVLAIRKGIGINYNNIGMDQARNNLDQVVSGLVQDCGGDYEALYIGSAALENTAEPEIIQAMAGNKMDPGKMVIESDAYMALMGMTLGEPGLIVICGTGSMLVMDDGTGQQIMGGWGSILNDPGSGYAVALDGIRASIKHWEGTGESTVLGDETLRYFGIQHPRQLTEKIYTPDCGVDVIARFSENVFIAAERGDGVAVQIIQKQMDEIAKEAAALLKKAPDVKNVGLYGGIFQHQRLARTLFSIRMAEKTLDRTINFLTPEYPPELGAVILYFKRHNMLTDDVLRQMKQSYQKWAIGG